MIYTKADMMALWGWKRKSRRWRRRVLAAMVAHNANERTTREYTTRQPRTFGRNRGHALNEMSTLTPLEFLRMFRVDRDTFDDLEQKVAPLVVRNVQQARNACENGLSGEIKARTRLAVTLRWLAGGVLFPMSQEGGDAADSDCEVVFSVGPPSPHAMSNQQSACDEFDVSAFDFGNEEEADTWEASGQYQQGDSKQDDESADKDDRDVDPVITILAGT
ncbi:hypothetical protein B484DRAFT_436087 [Ochromonadaceae sp. CCMP2298]|nr:hypothetical protein B484DRAFT_436087 [Ochromonadaceae sp. CCMP2298]